MLTYKLHFMYDGTNYSGWQVQPNATSIQQLIQETIQLVIHESVSVVGSGRTDAGVHAFDQVAHFRSEQTVDLERFSRSLNGILPKDIRLTKAEKVENSFHAQKSAFSKEYHYVLCLGPVVPPFEKEYCLHIPFEIDIELLKQAASCFVGTHDFTSFANKSLEGAASKNPVRTIYRLDVVPWQYGLRLEFEGSGFLYKMVRNIVGMLLAVGSKKRPLAEIPHLFAAKDRRLAPMGASARGLFLVGVRYPEIISSK
jgi:tRNA pseudouridine38-40 synthase